MMTLMATIKNDLTKTFLLDDNKQEITRLLKSTADTYRPYDPGQYLYNLVIDFPKESRFSEKFIELTYTTLISWNMNQRGAKLSDYDLYMKSLIENKNLIQSLQNERIEKIDNVNEILQSLKHLFENLKLVAKDKPKLVTFSKTLHFFLPNLLMPIDRSYTIRFFYKNTGVPQADEKQFEMYKDIFLQFRQLSMSYDFELHLDNKWNRNIPKMIDNLVIAYIKRERQI